MVILSAIRGIGFKNLLRGLYGIEDGSQHSPVSPTKQGSQYGFHGFDWLQGGGYPTFVTSELEDIKFLESAFQFWDSRLESPVHMKLEALIFVEDLEGKIILFETKDFESSGPVLIAPTIVPELPVVGTKLVETNITNGIENKGTMDVSITSSDPSVTDEDRLDGRASFLSKRMSTAAEAVWREQVEKLIIWQQKEDRIDHEWQVNLQAQWGVNFGTPGQQ
ncbi:hypothetical protein R1sor_014859 [Riccia sorocarpa]|uniref:Uncharacterized protein n=1 Tax=Riccia sorocarpa TaxID=122646 RepID=A0ABD3HEF1_9MARC